MEVVMKLLGLYWQSSSIGRKTIIYALLRYIRSGSKRGAEMPIHSAKAPAIDWSRYDAPTVIRRKGAGNRAFLL